MRLVCSLWSSEEDSGILWLVSVGFFGKESSVPTGEESLVTVFFCCSPKSSANMFAKHIINIRKKVSTPEIF